MTDTANPAAPYHNHYTDQNCPACMRARALEAELARYKKWGFDQLWARAEKVEAAYRDSERKVIELAEKLTKAEARVAELEQWIGTLTGDTPGIRKAIEDLEAREKEVI